MEKLFLGFLTQIKRLINCDENIYSSERIEENVHLFVNSITPELRELFLKSKIKLFSNKSENTKIVSNSLFGESLPLKVVFNNQPDYVKKVFWNYLYKLYITVEDDEEVRLLIDENLDTELEQLTEKNLSSKVKENLFNVEVNKDTSNMIDDIVNGFQNTMGKNKNPFDSILEITEDISKKYGSKMENGDLDIEKLMGSINKSMPGMEDMMKNFNPTNMFKKEQKPKETVIIDENFSTANVEQGERDETVSKPMLSKVMNMIPGGSSEGESNPLGGLMNMMGKLGNIQSEDELKGMKSEMDGLMKSMGMDIDKLNATMEKIQKREEQSSNELIEE